MEACAHVASIRESKTNRSIARAGCLQAARSFFTKANEEALVWPLAHSLGHIPGEFDQAPYFLDSAGRACVVGTFPIQAFPANGPASKYEALFDANPCFDCIRESFIVSCDPRSKVKTFQTKLLDMHLDDNVVESISGLLEALRCFDDVPVSDHLSRHFVMRAWPSYVQALCDPDYWLSANELVLLAAMSNINVAIFACVDSVLTLVNSYTPAGASPVLIKLDGNNIARVRSHFERLHLDAVANVGSPDGSPPENAGSGSSAHVPGAKTTGTASQAAASSSEDMLGSQHASGGGQHSPDAVSAADASTVSSSDPPATSGTESLPRQSALPEPTDAPCLGGSVTEDISFGSASHVPGAKQTGASLPAAAPGSQDMCASHHTSETGHDCPDAAPLCQRGMPDFEKMLLGYSIGARTANASTDLSGEPPATSGTENLPKPNSLPDCEKMFQDVSTGATNDDTDSLSSVSDASDASDVFHVAALPRHLRTWETVEDLETRRIHALARHIRERPLLPLKPGSTTEVFTDIDSGICLPFAHCFFKGCTWTLTRRPEKLEKNVSSRESSHCHLRKHCTADHGNIFLESLGSDVPGPEYIDYLEEAVKVRERGHQGYLASHIVQVCWP